MQQQAWPRPIDRSTVRNRMQQRAWSSNRMQQQECSLDQTKQIDRSISIDIDRPKYVTIKTSSSAAAASATASVAAAAVSKKKKKYHGWLKERKKNYVLFWKN